MDDSLLQLGVGGIFAVLIIKEVLTFVSGLREKKDDSAGGGATTRRGEQPDCASCMQTLRAMGNQMEDLYQWHNVKDPTTGVFVWYGNVSGLAIQKILEAVSANISAQTDALRELTSMVVQVRQTSVETRELVRVVSETQLRDEQLVRDVLAKQDDRAVPRRRAS